MSSRRKAAVISDNVVDSTSDNITAKVKKNRKTKAATQSNEVDDHISSPPKRSRPVRTKKVVSYDDNKNAGDDTPKPKKESKTKKPLKKEKKSSQPGPSSQVVTDIPDVKENKKVKKEKKEKGKKEKTKEIKYEETENTNLANGRPLEENKSKVEKILQNKTDTEWNTIDFGCSKTNGYHLKNNLIISTWNIGGIKSWIKKGCLEFLKHETPDILCLQETKCSKEKLPDELNKLKHYRQYWCSSEKEGYAGVGLLTIKQPKTVTYGINNKEQDIDGRCITAEYDEFILVNVYVPNAGRKLVTLPKRLEWNKAFKEYITILNKKKPLIICGDMNVSHNEIDLARPKNNKKNAGFTQEERDGMTDFLKDGFIDVYRHFYPNDEGIYSFWTYMANARTNNVGWRLDYFLLSKQIIKSVCDVTYRTQILGSDHCPLTLFINI